MNNIKYQKEKHKCYIIKIKVEKKILTLNTKFLQNYKFVKKNSYKIQEYKQNLRIMSKIYYMVRKKNEQFLIPLNAHTMSLILPLLGDKKNLNRRNKKRPKKSDISYGIKFCEYLL